MIWVKKKAVVIRSSFRALPVDAGIGFDQVLDDGDAGGVGQGLHHAGELVLLVGEYFWLREAHVLIVSLQYSMVFGIVQIYFIALGEAPRSAGSNQKSDVSLWKY